MKPEELAKRIHHTIAEEYEKTRQWILKLTGDSDLLENTPVVRRTVAMRNPTVAPLNKLQVALLELWDDKQQDTEAMDVAWTEAILLSITGIAAAMQSTG